MAAHIHDKCIVTSTPFFVAFLGQHLMIRLHYLLDVEYIKHLIRQDLINLLITVRVGGCEWLVCYEMV